MGEQGVTFTDSSNLWKSLNLKIKKKTERHLRGAAGKRQQLKISSTHTENKLIRLKRFGEFGVYITMGPPPPLKAHNEI